MPSEEAETRMQRREWLLKRIEDPRSKETSIDQYKDDLYNLELNQHLVVCKTIRNKLRRSSVDYKDFACHDIAQRIERIRGMSIETCDVISRLDDFMVKKYTS